MRAGLGGLEACQANLGILGGRDVFDFFGLVRHAVTPQSGKGQGQHDARGDGLSAGPARRRAGGGWGIARNGSKMSYVARVGKQWRRAWAGTWPGRTW